MTSANGQLTEAELVRVEKPEQLSNLTARAYRHLVIAGREAGIKIGLASPGAGYRSLAVQDEMRRGSLGDRALAAKWGLNPNSSVPLAAAGYSTHGTGTRADLLFNGSSWPSAAQIALAARYGWTREFGSDDPNHFKHDGKSALAPIHDADLVKWHIYPHDGTVPVAPAPVIHTVVSGDTLTALAEHYHTTVPAIVALNHLSDPDNLAIGQRVRVK